MGFISMVGSLFGCSAQQNADFKTVDVAEFERVIAQPDVQRLDVRTADEYNDGHIAGAVNIDVLKDDFEPKAVSALSKDKPVALYCRSGNRSKKAAAILAAKGYEVIELATGYNGWTRESRSVTTE